MKISLDKLIRRETNKLDLNFSQKIDTINYCNNNYKLSSPINIEGTSVVIKNGKEELKLYFDEGYDLQVLKEEYENHKMEECIAYILQASKKDKGNNVCCRVLIK
ncbi:MAG: hypothetical protein E7K67_06965 [Peptostreptococcaceae bacterium]|nr:hypothetical protein [Peptostreptococcaceae bacterium]